MRRAVTRSGSYESAQHTRSCPCRIRHYYNYPNSSYSAENDLADIKTEIAKRHDEAVKRLQDWIGQVSIAAENRDIRSAEYMAKLARDAGFQRATVINTDGKPAYSRRGCRRTENDRSYFMYDVKQFDPANDVTADGSANRGQTPWEGDRRARRGEPKGPEAAFLAALHAFAVQ